MKTSIKTDFFAGLKNILKKNKSLVLSFIFIFSGVIFGTIVYNLDISGLYQEMMEVFLAFNIDFNDKSSIELFAGLILSGFIYFASMFVLGGNFFGKELILFVTMIKSSGIGALIAYLYSEYGIRGFEYTLLIFIPGKFILLFGMLLMTKCCYDMSDTLRRGITEQGSIKTYMKEYTVKSFISLFVFFLSWFIDFVCICTFLQLFSFI